MPLLPRRSFTILVVALLAATQMFAAPTPAPLRFDSGAATLDGPWQFHLGDDPAWATPGFNDSSWQQLSPDRPWGKQGHPNTAGYAWYRLHLTLEPGEHSDQLAILFPIVEDAYELYWNGQLVGTYGVLPPHPVWYFELMPRTFGLGPAQPGVLAVRIWKAPFASFDTGLQGGFYKPPVSRQPAGHRWPARRPGLRVAAR